MAADQWLEYFNCEALPETILAVKGRKRVNSRGRTVPGNDNIISNGSKIAVADGQCMIIVEQGRILDVCAEPGEYKFDLGSEPSLFGGGAFGDNAPGALNNTWVRFKFGGQPGKDTRVYFFNTKELVGNNYGTPNPVPFRVVDTNIGLDVDIAIRFFGQYSYRISDPILFYTNVAGNFPAAYTRQQIEGQLKAELLAALQLSRGSQRLASATPRSPVTRPNWPRHSMRCSPRSGGICAASRSCPSASPPSTQAPKTSR